ncbi:(S)-mandelate dehydrogenase [Terricaulis silvestris]|uniref:(S)-mandelate dehydrogenase n=1 Tax=Terricaulis silvestris TaxID=2686094 RepID=A0A6I6MNJ8_9CAUL|nr:(S)-mandelate dehydrogenase [Terricaulis silvestris]
MTRWGWALRRASSVDDLRALARRRLPQVVFDSIDGGAGDETTLRANRSAFEAVMLRPRQANPPASIDTSIELFGDRLLSPILLAPCGSTRVVYPDGERVVAREAARAGVGYVVPHLGGTASEDVAAVSDGVLWYQVYKYGGRDVLEPALKRAWDAGFRVLVVTIDNTRALLERDVRNGLDVLLDHDWIEGAPYLPQMLARPGWVLRFLSEGGRRAVPNARLPDGRSMNASDIATLGKQSTSYFNWDDFGWLREAWPGSIVVKGVLTAADAELAVTCGAQGIIVSNHGGRGLDGVAPSLRALPEIVDAVGDAAVVMLDGGVRRGTDVLKALALGARAVLIGRPYLYGLASGPAGVARLLTLLQEDLTRSLAGLGCASLDELGSDFVQSPAEWRMPRQPKSDSAVRLAEPSPEGLQRRARI